MHTTKLNNLFHGHTNIKRTIAKMSRPAKIHTLKKKYVNKLKVGGGLEFAYQIVNKILGFFSITMNISFRQMLKHYFYINILGMQQKLVFVLIVLIARS